MSYRSAVFLIAFSLAGSALADTPCEHPKNLAELISAEARPLAPSQFASISVEMTIAQIVERLGPASREVGSGLLILEWRSTDGRAFLVGGTSVCERPLYARFNTDVARRS